MEDKAQTAVSTGPCLPVLKPFWSNPGPAVKESRQMHTLLYVHVKTYAMGRHSVHANTCVHMYKLTYVHATTHVYALMHVEYLYVMILCVCVCSA